MSKLARDAGVTERLKAGDLMAWVEKMNAWKAQAEEIILRELMMGRASNPDRLCPESGMVSIRPDSRLATDTWLDAAWSSQAWQQA